MPENKINQLEKNKEFFKNNTLILKSHQRFRSQKQCIY